MLWVVKKSGVRTDDRLSLRAEAAVRAVAVRAVGAGDLDSGTAAVALEVLRQVRKKNYWLECDCREQGGRRPLVVPCHLAKGVGYTWRVLTAEGRIPHADDCVFYREEKSSRFEAAWARVARSRPDGMFAVLGNEQEADRLGEWSESSSSGSGSGRRVSALSRLQLLLMESAGLTSVKSDDDPWQLRDVMKALRMAAHSFSVAPGRPLSDLLFTYREDWDKRRVHARIRAAAGGWPEGSKPQGFLCCVVRRFDRTGLPETPRFTAVAVERAIQRPTIGRNSVTPPYLFFGVIGKLGKIKGYGCVAGYAQPIVAPEWPVPVDSGYERQAFGTLRYTVQILAKRFEGVEFTIEKPVFEIDTKEGPCLPDFLVRARCGKQEAVFVIEVMGFDRPSYLEGKEVTHPRMERLGRLLLMDGSSFERGGLTEQGRKVTQGIGEELRQRWG